MARQLHPLLNRKQCPVCLHKHSSERWTVCAECGTHGRSTDQNVEPIGKCWYIFKPPYGWAEMTMFGFKMRFDETTCPTRPKEDAPRSKQQDDDSYAAEELACRLGIKANPL